MRLEKLLGFFEKGYTFFQAVSTHRIRNQNLARFGPKKGHRPCRGSGLNLEKVIPFRHGQTGWRWDAKAHPTLWRSCAGMTRGVLGGGAADG
jgi:hypothetical protein